MKTKLYIIMLALLPIGIASCGSSQTAAQKQEIANEIREKVNNFDFTFKATYAYPTSFRSINLSPFYDVKVSPEKITAYLPYYGRAYSAPMDSSEGGIKFESTTFEYKVNKGKKSGNWLINIQVRDKGKEITLLFDIWENGTARLSVSDPNRQPISFTGDIEINDKE